MEKKKNLKDKIQEERKLVEIKKMEKKEKCDYIYYLGFLYCRLIKMVLYDKIL